MKLVTIVSIFYMLSSTLREKISKCNYRQLMVITIGIWNIYIIIQWQTLYYINK
jgi:hypothetical protein